MTELTGQELLGRTPSSSSPHRFHAVNPATGEVLPPEYADATAEEIDRAVTLADAAFDTYRERSPAEIAGSVRGVSDPPRVDDELIRRELAREGVTMALYVSLTLLTALIAIPSDDVPGTLGTAALIWGACAGLAPPSTSAA